MDTLRKLMRGNGAFSIASGTLLLVGSAAWSESFGLETWFLVVAGVGLAGYGALLVTLSRRPNPRGGGWFATAMDFGWVVGAGVILAGFPTAMTGIGRMALGLATIAVIAFGLGQLTALRRSAAS